MSLADTNNNPGNIRDSSWTQSQPGYVGSNKGFAVFKTVQDGFNAQVNLLKNYYNKGRTSVNSIISKYAPSNENNTGSYTNTVSQWLGVNPNDTLSFGNLSDLAASMARYEGFANWKSLATGNAKSNDSPTTTNPSSVVSSVASALTPQWFTDLINGHTAARWISVIIGIILIALAVAAFTLTSDTGKQVIAAVK